MLVHLQIKDFVLIESLSLAFSSGFNALTGETGAGKSLIVTSFDLLLGRRATSQLVRKGAKEAEIEGLFDISDAEDIKIRLKESGFPVDDELLIRRIILANGRHKCFVNGKLASLGVLANLSDGLANVMGQHEHHVLLNDLAQLNLLDNYGGYKKELEQMATTYLNFKKCQQEYTELLTENHGRAYFTGHKQPNLKQQK